MNIEINDIGHMIQLAITPVFLLTGVGTTLLVLTNRLGRIIDRTRVLEERCKARPNLEDEVELKVLYKRSYLINFAITSSTFSGLLVCVVIAMLFLGDSTNLPLDQFIAACFVLAMFGLISSFVHFLREIFIGSRFMRMHQLGPRTQGRSG